MPQRDTQTQGKAQPSPLASSQAPAISLPEGGGAIKGYRREVLRQPGYRHRLDDGPDCGQPRPFRLWPAAIARLRPPALATAHLASARSFPLRLLNSN